MTIVQWILFCAESVLINTLLLTILRELRRRRR